MRVALIGWPLGHSVSPAMQNAAFSACGIQGTYEAVPTPPDDFEGTVARLRAEGYAGANVTIPHKVAALRLADDASPQTRAAGAANTLLFRGGRVEARNTDVSGFLASWKASLGLDRLRDASVLVLGAGGAARAVLVALTHARVKRVSLLARKPEQAHRVLQEISGPRWPNYETRVHFLTNEDFARTLQSASAVINTTPLGMSPNPDDAPVTWPKEIPAGLAACDVVYNPRPTRFLREAAARGADTLDGLGMLVEQGAAAFEAWTGATAPREVMWTAAEAALQK
ncbi:MAG: shikimate dehydrogenase [Armatimonadetes bacterium]|nr:shikimate dehydrogenase [Armatimonadota bacterium]